MIDSMDVTEQELEVLRGDAVGNNLCSSKWIINTLMSLCKIDENGWTKELEEQLCMLWDLSMEEDVMSYLKSYDFLKIAKNTLMTSDIPRLIEIILGIIGNMCCNDGTIDTIGCDQELVVQILSYLKSDDSLTLIQLLRILRSIAIKIHREPQSNWVVHFTECEFFKDCIIFMLVSSTNDDLLIAAIKLLESISDIKLPDKNSFLDKLFKMNNLIPALLESFTQVVKSAESSYSETELKFVQYWVALLLTITECDSLIFDDFVTDESFLKLMEIMYRILKPWEKNLVSITKLNAEVINDTVQILLNFRCCGANISPRIDHIIVTLIFSLKKVLESDSGKESESDEPDELITGLLDCLNEHWLYIIKLCTCEQIVEILGLCECEVREHLMALMQSNSKMTPEVLDKVKKVATAVQKS